MIPDPRSPQGPDAEQRASLERTRDELTLVLERLRHLTGGHAIPVPRGARCEADPYADPYPAIRDNLRTALAHLP